MLDDAELARRSLANFGEMLAALGRCSSGAGAELRRPDALGAQCAALPSSPWLAAVVVPADAAPPADDASLPCCVWSLSPAPGRVHDPRLVMPVMGRVLDAAACEAATSADAAAGTHALCEPSFAEVAVLNARAWAEPPDGAYARVLSALGADARARTLGLRDGSGVLTCAAVTLTLGDDCGVHMVSTHISHRRQGLATRLVRALLARAASEGACTATLQASAEGARVYERLGFRTVATLHGFRRQGDVGHAPGADA
jgi:GNAT superfamily N-acetyltransferase